MVKPDEICREINKSYGCPIIPSRYTGQLTVGCRVFKDYGHRIYLGSGGAWTFTDRGDTYNVKFIGDNNPYWPSYHYHNFSCVLVRQGVLPRSYFDG